MPSELSNCDAWARDWQTFGPQRHHRIDRCGKHLEPQLSDRKAWSFDVDYSNLSLVGYGCLYNHRPKYVLDNRGTCTRTHSFHHTHEHSLPVSFKVPVPSPTSGVSAASRDWPEFYTSGRSLEAYQLLAQTRSYQMNPGIQLDGDGLPLVLSSSRT
jgi:hypothetical protein